MSRQEAGACLLTCHFGDALQTRDGQGHHEPQAGAHHQQAVADEQAGHGQPLVPCGDGEGRPGGQACCLSWDGPGPRATSTASLQGAP